METTMESACDQHEAIIDEFLSSFEIQKQGLQISIGSEVGVRPDSVAQTQNDTAGRESSGADPQAQTAEPMEHANSQDSAKKSEEDGRSESNENFNSKSSVPNGNSLDEKGPDLKSSPSQDTALASSNKKKELYHSDENQPRTSLVPDASSSNEVIRRPGTLGIDAKFELLKHQCETWPVLWSALMAVENLSRSLIAKQSDAKDTSKSADKEHGRRSQRVSAEIQKLRSGYAKTKAERERKEHEERIAITALRRSRETRTNLKKEAAEARAQLEGLQSRLLSALRERLRDPFYPFAPLSKDGRQIWESLPRSAIERILLFLPAREIVQSERVCKSWVRLLGKTKTLRRLLRKRREEDDTLEEQAVRARTLSESSDSKEKKKMEYEEHYVLNIEVGTSGNYVVSAVKQSVPLSFLSPVGDSPNRWDEDENAGERDPGAEERNRSHSRPSIAMKPVVQRDKSKRSVRIMFTNRSYSSVREEMSFVSNAFKHNKVLSALRKRVNYLRSETDGDGNAARKWFKKEIEVVQAKIARCQEHISAYKQQLESDEATRKFLAQTLESSQLGHVNLKEANAKMLTDGQKQVRAKELELKQAEEAKVGQQKKLEELNTHLKILVTTARSLKSNVTSLKAQRDQLKARLKNMIEA